MNALPDGEGVPGCPPGPVLLRPTPRRPVRPLPIRDPGAITLPRHGALPVPGRVRRCGLARRAGSPPSSEAAAVRQHTHRAANANSLDDNLLVVLGDKQAHLWMGRERLIARSATPHSRLRRPGKRPSLAYDRSPAARGPLGRVVGRPYGGASTASIRDRWIRSPSSDPRTGQPGQCPVLSLCSTAGCLWVFPRRRAEPVRAARRRFTAYGPERRATIPLDLRGPSGSALAGGYAVRPFDPRTGQFIYRARHTRSPQHQQRRV